MFAQVSASAARGLVAKYDVRPDGKLDVGEFAALVDDLEGVANGLLLPPPRDVPCAPCDAPYEGWRTQTVVGEHDRAPSPAGVSSLEATHRMSSRLLAAEANAAAAAAELARVRNEAAFRELS